MVDAVSRELILPGVRLDLPPRPSAAQVQALAGHSADAWTTTPGDWVTQQVVRLAVAALLGARLEPRPGVVQHHELSADPAQVTLAELATLFRPHVDLTRQAFGLAVVESVNAAVPAAVDPLRDGLRRVGVAGRDSVRVVALGLDKLPPRARSGFWDGVRGSDTVTAIVDALASGRGESGRPHDVSGLDRSRLARADALVLAGGRTTPVTFGAAPSAGDGWFDVPLSVVRRERAGGLGDGRGGGRDGRDGRGESRSGVEVALRGEGWVEVLETALDAISAAMRQLDLGAQPRGLRGPAAALAGRLAAAGSRTVADVCGSLREVGATALEVFDPQVSTAPVPVAVPVVDDELFVQLWLPTSALAGPLVTGATDLFLGGPAQVRSPQGGAASARPGRTQGRAAQARPGAAAGRSGRSAQGSAAEPVQESVGGAVGESADHTRPRRSRGGRGRRSGRGDGVAAAPGAPASQMPTEAPATEAPPSTPTTSSEPSPADPPA